MSDITQSRTKNIHSLQRAIVFVMAEWSGQAKLAFRQLTNYLAEHSIPAEWLICIDIDRELKDYDLPELLGKVHGYGEAAVVKDGRIVFVTSLGQEKSKIKQRCEELLAAFEN